ncbi:hypothetical protein J7K50_02250 [bacterium]|nr:hypothetical protein [bacterium]
MNEKEFQAWNEARLEKIRDLKSRRYGPIEIEHGYRTYISHANYSLDEEGESSPIVRLVEDYPPADLVISRHLAVARYFARIHAFGGARRVTWLKRARNRRDITGTPFGDRKRVYTTRGYLSLDLAACSEELIELALDLPEELQSSEVELTLEQVEEYASGELKAYSVTVTEFENAKTPMANGNVIVVTRHPAFVTYLEGRGLVPVGTPVVENATAENIEGKTVYTIRRNIPPHIAVHARRVIEFTLDLPEELRSGVTLTPEQIEEHACVFTQAFSVSAVEPPDTPGYIPPDLRERVEKARREAEAHRSELWKLLNKRPSGI